MNPQVGRARCGALAAWARAMASGPRLRGKHGRAGVAPALAALAAALAPLAVLLLLASFAAAAGPPAGDAATDEALARKEAEVTRLLRDAAAGSHTACVKCLLTAGAAPHAADAFGRTALHAAAERGAVSCAELLLQAAAAERGRDTALARAATLQEQGARTACHEAARAGAEELVRALCARGADVDARDAHSRTPLIEAVRKKHAAVISALLVDFGAAVSIKDERGDNALHFAAASGQMRVLRTALERRARQQGAEREEHAVLSQAAAAARDFSEGAAYTPLHVSVVAGDVAAAEDLVVLGGVQALLLRDAEGRTAAELAEELGRPVAFQRVCDPKRVSRLALADEVASVHANLRQHRQQFAKALEPPS